MNGYCRECKRDFLMYVEDLPTGLRITNSHRHAVTVQGAVTIARMKPIPASTTVEMVVAE